MVQILCRKAVGPILSLRRNRAGTDKVERKTVAARGNSMSRSDLVLALLASAGGRAYTPAQLQKTTFLVTENLPHLITGEGFDFQPYDYGPFDKDVYVEAQRLRDGGEAVISPAASGRWVNYAASQEGLGRGLSILNSLSTETQNYISNVSAWALSQSFSSLVKSVYDAYPAMRANSIFRDPA